MTYLEKLKSPKWQKKRLQIFTRDNFTCKLCKDNESALHIHHLKYTKEPCDAPKEDLITLCEHCHFLLSKSNILFSEIIKIKKFLTIYKDSSKIGYVIKDKNGVSFYELLENDVNRIIKFLPKSKVLQTIYTMNNG